MIRFDSTEMLQIFWKKDVINKIKRQEADWKKIFTTYRAENSYYLYKIFCKLIRKTIQLFKKVIYKIIQLRN